MGQRRSELRFSTPWTVNGHGGVIAFVQRLLRVGTERPAQRCLRREIQSGWPRRSSPWGTWRLLGRSRRAHVWRRFVPIISFDDALVLYALLTLFGRHGEAAWRGQDDTGRTRAAFRAGGRQVAFRHRSQLCEWPALLAHIFVRRHRPPTSGQNASCGGPVRRVETIPVDSWVVNVIGHFLARGPPR
jgi:hypothetical protein